jgi:hypothetical protein
MRRKIDLIVLNFSTTSAFIISPLISIEDRPGKANILASTPGQDVNFQEMS